MQLKDIPHHRNGILEGCSHNLRYSPSIELPDAACFVTEAADSPSFLISSKQACTAPFRHLGLRFKSLVQGSGLGQDATFRTPLGMNSSLILDTQKHDPAATPSKISDLRERESHVAFQGTYYCCYYCYYTILLITIVMIIIRIVTAAGQKFATQTSVDMLSGLEALECPLITNSCCCLKSCCLKRDWKPRNAR